MTLKTPREEFEAELHRLVQQNPLFPFFVLYGMDALHSYLKDQPDSHVATLFGGEFDPDDIRDELQSIRERLAVVAGRRNLPHS